MLDIESIIEYFCNKTRNMRVLLTFIILVIGVFTAYYITKSSQERKQLPVIQPRDVNSEMVDPELITMGIGHRIREFSFSNQNVRVL